MDEKRRRIACVIGASGMIGSKIVIRLLRLGYNVRILSRQSNFNIEGAELYVGALDNEEKLQEVLLGAYMVFHCAAELHDKTKMWNVNVCGTERLLRAAREAKIRYFCYISSSGVIGRTSLKWVDERVPCQPQDPYECSKYEAEKRVMQGLENCKVVSLRPTNVVDRHRPGAVALPMRGNCLDYFKIVLKGSECAHLIHADDVAAAALHFIDYPIDSPQCFFVSTDDQPYNTYAGLWNLCRSQLTGKAMSETEIPFQLPVFVPFLLRTLLSGKIRPLGDVRYSSNKLKRFGFTLPLGLSGAIDDIIPNKELIKCESSKC